MWRPSTILPVKCTPSCICAYLQRRVARTVNAAVQNILPLGREDPREILILDFTSASLPANDASIIFAIGTRAEAKTLFSLKCKLTMMLVFMSFMVPAINDSADTFFHVQVLLFGVKTCGNSGCCKGFEVRCMRLTPRKGFAFGLVSGRPWRPTLSSWILASVLHSAEQWKNILPTAFPFFQSSSWCFFGASMRVSSRHFTDPIIRCSSVLLVLKMLTDLSVNVQDAVRRLDATAENSTSILRVNRGVLVSRRISVRPPSPM
mmetsp:Transcript_20111/g.31921  ORF Transcript_20111/g.31921 Transcript_20111/m.31921 type:complete len:262 (+) Transcript_20111:1277-2062(+)